jgi:hypothetical protein
VGWFHLACLHLLVRGLRLRVGPVRGLRLRIAMVGVAPVAGGAIGYAAAGSAVSPVRSLRHWK